MIEKRYLFSCIAVALLASLAVTNVPVQAPLPTVRIIAHAYSPYVDGVPPGLPPIPSPGSLVFVHLYIETTIPDYSPGGIVGWAINAKVDPTVLEPIGVQGAAPGYFLYDFWMRIYPPYPIPYPSLPPPDIDKEAGTIRIGEFLPSVSTVGAGNVPGQMPYKLVTLIFESLSETAYSPIDLFYEEGIDAWYWTADMGAIPVPVVVDGHYNMPPDARTIDATGTVTPPAPIGSDWHEIEPNFSTSWSLESWEDNGDGILSASDQVDMQRPSDPAPLWFHVEWVAPLIIANDGNPDMMVTEKPPVPEFPLGSVVPIALFVAVAYLWLMKKRERPKIMCPRKER